jgi:hypothetical protein
VKFRKGQSGNPGGRPKVLGEVQELARQHAPAVIVELARLALKAKSETARIAAIRELLDRGYGRPRQTMEVSIPADNPLQMLHRFPSMKKTDAASDRGRGVFL